jgi:hypothetical protein
MAMFVIQLNYARLLYEGFKNYNFQIMSLRETPRRIFGRSKINDFTRKLSPDSSKLNISFLPKFCQVQRPTN